MFLLKKFGLPSECKPTSANTSLWCVVTQLYKSSCFVGRYIILPPYQLIDGCYKLDLVVSIKFDCIKFDCIRVNNLQGKQILLWLCDVEFDIMLMFKP